MVGKKKIYDFEYKIRYIKIKQKLIPFFYSFTNWYSLRCFEDSLREKTLEN